MHATYMPGNHTFASVNVPEEYDFLKTSFERVWRVFIRDSYVYVDGKGIHLKIVSRSDYKVHFSVNHGRLTNDVVMYRVQSYPVYRDCQFHF